MLEDTIRNYQVILASASPRRKNLLEQMAIDFIIDPKDVDEVFPEGMPPVEVAEFLSKKKAGVFHESELNDQTFILAADTILALEGKILGKPEDKKHADVILRELSRKTH